MPKPKKTTTSPPTTIKQPVVTICITAKQLADNPHIMRATIELLTALGMSHDHIPH